MGTTSTTEMDSTNKEDLVAAGIMAEDSLIKNDCESSNDSNSHAVAKLPSSMQVNTKMESGRGMPKQRIRIRQKNNLCLKSPSISTDTKPIFNEAFCVTGLNKNKV